MSVSFAQFTKSIQNGHEEEKAGSMEPVFQVPKAKDRPSFGTFTPTTSPNAGTSLSNPGFLGNNENENTARLFESLDLFEPFAEGIEMLHVPSINYYKAVKKGDISEAMYARIPKLTLPFPTTTYDGPGFTKTTARMNIPEATANNLYKLAQFMGQLANIPGEIDCSKILYQNEKGYWSWTMSITNKSLVYLNDGSVCNTMPQIPAGEYQNAIVQIGIYHNANKGTYQLTSNLGRGEFLGPRSLSK